MESVNETTDVGTDDSRPREMKLIYRAGRGLFRGLFSNYFGWEIHGRERMPMSGPVLLAANHESYIDPGAIGSSVDREVHYLARENVFRIPLFGTLLRKVNAIPVNQEGGAMAGLRAGLEVLEGGNALLLFPEGSRTPDGHMHPFRSGVGLIAAKSAAPVLPVRVFGLYEAYGRHLRFPRPRKVVVKLGRLMSFDEETAALRSGERKPREIYQKIADDIQAAVASLKPGPDDA